MKIAIQICLFNGWDNNAAAIHDVKSPIDAIALAEFMSHQFGNASVRLTYPTVAGLDENKYNLQRYIGALNGAYIQCTINNENEKTITWVETLSQVVKM